MGERKVWEESWSMALNKRGISELSYSSDEHTFADAWCEDDTERFRLASAAPDMVRVLLAVEWVDNNTDEPGRYTRHCSACQEYFPKHAPDCALDAALRKAGVR